MGGEENEFDRLNGRVTVFQKIEILPQESGIGTTFLLERTPFTYETRILTYSLGLVHGPHTNTF